MRSERERRVAAAARKTAPPVLDAHVRSWAAWGMASSVCEVFDDLDDGEQIAVDAWWAWYQRLP